MVKIVRQFKTLQFDALLAAAVANLLLATGIIDQYAPHALRGGPEEMSTILPAPVRCPRQAQPGFVDQRGRLKSLVRSFIRQLPRREPAQLVINEWKQVRGGRLVVGTIGMPRSRSRVTHRGFSIKGRARDNQWVIPVSRLPRPTAFVKSQLGVDAPGLIMQPAKDKIQFL